MSQLSYVQYVLLDADNDPVLLYEQSDNSWPIRASDLGTLVALIEDWMDKSLEPSDWGADGDLYGHKIVRELVATTELTDMEQAELAKLAER